MQSAIAAAIQDVFLKVIKSQKNFKNTSELIDAGFMPAFDLPSQDRALLVELRTPKIYSLKDGLAFEFGIDQGFKVQLVNNQIEDSDLFVKKTSHHRGSWLQLVEPQAFALAPLVIAAGVAVARPLIVAGIRKILVQVVSGAALGCSFELSRNSGKETIETACLDGAKEGALLLLGGVGLGRLWKAAGSGSKWAQITVAVGLAAGIALVGSTGAELATLNSSILRCTGASGDFILSARKNGLTGRTLYESSEDKIAFLLSEKKELKSVVVGATQEDLIKFFNEKEIFPAVSGENLKNTAKVILEQTSEYRKECKTHGDGYTRRLWSSEGEKLQNQHTSQDVTK